MIFRQYGLKSSEIFLVLINSFSETPDSCGHFEPIISPIGRL
jgi:hypothetical protein